AVLSALYAELDALNAWESSDAGPRAFEQLIDRGLPQDDELRPYVLTGEDRTREKWLKNFRAISLAHSPDLEDRALREAIQTMLKQLRTLPRYQELVIQALRDMDARSRAFPQDETSWYWWERFDETLNTTRESLDKLRGMEHYKRLQEDNPKKVKHLTQLAHATDVMEGVVAILSRSDGHDAKRWDEIVEAGKAMETMTLPSLSNRNSTSEAVQDKNAYIELFLRQVLPLAGLITDQFNRKTGRFAHPLRNHPPVFTMRSPEIRQDLVDTGRAVARFMEIVLLVDQEFQRKRFQRNAIQFSDIEHAALELLNHEDIREEYQGRFDAIYIDEYQDTSSIQDAIIRTIDRDNVLMVGDVKQSIYRFRYANPALFAKREASSLLRKPGYSPSSLDSAESGRLALLNRNFRSRPGIIAFVNDFFGAFLTKSAGEIEYDETQRLESFHPPRDDGHPDVVWEIATRVDDDLKEQLESEPEDLLDDLDVPSSLREYEACMAARIIGELIDEGINPGQIAVLLPTNDNCRDYEEVLTRYGIPVTSRSGKIFPDNLVSRQIEALLSILDNPRQDIPLLSTLIGPFAPEPWNPEELLAIAVAGAAPGDEINKEKKSHRIAFHEQFFALCGDDRNPLADKARGFMTQVDRWRLMAQELSSRELLDLIFYETEYPAFIARGRFGPSHAVELEQVIDYIEQPDPGDLPGVRSTLRQLIRFREGEVNQKGPDNVLLPNAVNVLTRHSSKGLEWDYVILGGLDRKLRGPRSPSLISYSEQDGLSSYTITDNGSKVYNNPPNQTARVAEDKRARAEDWRLLYVAMTRARERLFLLLPTRKTLAEITGYQAIVDQANNLTAARSDFMDRSGRAVVPASLSADTGSDADLLLAVYAVRNPRVTEAVTSALEGNFSYDHHEVRVTPVAVIYQDIARRKAEQTAPAPSLEMKNGADVTARNHGAVEQLGKLLSAKIPRRDAAQTPAKITVTELKRLGRESDLRRSSEDETPDPTWTIEDLRSIHQKPAEIAPSAEDFKKADIPLTMREREQDKEPDGATIGTAMHSVFQFIRLEELRSLSEPEAAQAYLRQIDDMVSKQIIEKDLREEVAKFAAQTIAWAKSDLAGRLLRAEQTTGRVYHEMPFTVAVPSNNLDPSFPCDEVTLIQGMIDLWFIEEDGGAVLIDFKSDRLPKDQGDLILKDRYKIQLDAYADAISRAAGLQVKERLIWLIRESRCVAFEADRAR
ncbi:MAG TPA: UvrD-helicase domain-containing protein, partial [Clostridia bacterium]|nr:UvrD-helicase domain-containing protein [Clostridia bacterium]